MFLYFTPSLFIVCKSMLEINSFPKKFVYVLHRFVKTNADYFSTQSDFKKAFLLDIKVQPSLGVGVQYFLTGIIWGSREEMIFSRPRNCLLLQ